MPQVALGRAPRRRGSYRPGGAGAVRRPTTPANGGVGPVPPPDVAGSGHPAGGGPSGGVPRGRRAPAISLSLSPLPSHLPLSPAPSPLPGRGCRWPLEPRHGVGMARPTVTPGEGGGQSPLPLHRTLSGNPLPTLLPLGRR